MGVLLVAQALAGPQITTDPPPVEVTEPTMVVVIEAEETPDGEQARFDYTVRYLSTTADGVPIVQFELGVPWIPGGRITERPLALEAPAGWTAVAIPDSGSNPQTWRVSWSCAHSGWDHRLKFQIRPGQVVRGFRAWAPRGAASYATASYQVFEDTNRGARGPREVTGRVTQRRSK